MYETMIMEYENSLYMNEKSLATIQKYVRIAKQFVAFLAGREIRKALVLEYKESLMGTHKPAGVNVKIVAVNRFLRFLGKADCCVKSLRIQKQMFADEARELQKSEYQKLVDTARGTETHAILTTIFSTGIRVSELQYITVEAVQRGEALVNNKGKIRRILLPNKLCKQLKSYIRVNKIRSGSLFVNSRGKAYDRTTIWRKLKKLCKEANVAPEKVFPHNLRHLFARLFYQIEKDIVKLAEILGHSSIQTTRIYTLESGQNHRKGMDRVFDAVHIA